MYIIMLEKNKQLLSSANSIQKVISINIFIRLILMGVAKQKINSTARSLYAFAQTEP